MVNKLLNKRSKTTNVTELSVDDKLVTDTHAIADAFNKCFSEIRPNLAEKVIYNISPQNLNFTL